MSKSILFEEFDLRGVRFAEDRFIKVFQRVEVVAFRDVGDRPTELRAERLLQFSSC